LWPHSGLQVLGAQVPRTAGTDSFYATGSSRLLRDGLPLTHKRFSPEKKLVVSNTVSKRYSSPLYRCELKTTATCRATCFQEVEPLELGLEASC